MDEQGKRGLKLQMDPAQARRALPLLVALLGVTHATPAGAIGAAG